MSDLGKLVAVRYLHGRLVKGWTSDFRPNRDFFHVLEDGAETPTQVPIADLKAVFFIKTLAGDPRAVDKHAFDERPGTEKKVWLEFGDGERLAGWSNSHGSPKRGFYVFPADPDRNMEKAYVFRAALTRIEEGEAAEEASRAYCASSNASEHSTWIAMTSDDAAVGSYRLVRRSRPSR